MNEKEKELEAREKKPSSFSRFASFFSRSSSAFSRCRSSFSFESIAYFFAMYFRMSRETASTMTRPCTT